MGRWRWAIFLRRFAAWATTCTVLPMMNDRNRIPSLDGLRCIAVSLVLFSHLLGTRGFFSPPKTSLLYGFGNLGVQVFFVISGYLITHLLLSELQRTNKIHLGKFYFRRTLRIFPPCYFMIGGLILLTALGWSTLTPKDAFRALTYTSNYYPGRSWNIGHTWSLGVEEQFYLLWPAVLVILGRRKGFFAAASVIFICPIIRVLLWHFYRLPDIGHRFETVADAIATGCLLAGMREWLHTQKLYRSILESKFLLAAPIVVVAALILGPHPLSYFAVSPTVINLGIALCLDFAITYHRGVVGTILNSRPFVFMGVISYSTYLWQQIFLNRNSGSAITAFPLNITLAGAAAVASYYIVEQPCLRFRQRLEQRVFVHRREPAPVIAGESAAALAQSNAN